MEHTPNSQQLGTEQRQITEPAFSKRPWEISEFVDGDGQTVYTTRMPDGSNVASTSPAVIESLRILASDQP